MRATLLAAGLLAGLLVVSSGAADPLWSGPFAGTVEEGGSNVHAYATHPDWVMCAAVYMPHTFVVTLTGAAADTFGLAAGSLATTSTAGVATLTFTANYCTAFDITVTGLDIEVGAYAVVVEHVNSMNTVCCIDWA
jgi:hypothetical protein